MFHELEDQNLSLIQNGQDMEENIDEIKSQANVSLYFWPIFDAYNITSCYISDSITDGPSERLTCILLASPSKV